MNIDSSLIGKKLTRSSYSPIQYFIPLHMDVNGAVYGTREDGAGRFFDTSSTDWVLWEEPKKKVKYWLWASRKGKVTKFMHATAPGFLCDYSGDETAHDYCIKLLWSETEMEE